MSVSLAAPELNLEPRARAGVPVVPQWTLPRGRLNQLLDAGTLGVVTVVSAPTGAGKTLGVASWAAGPTSPSNVVWLNLGRGGAEPDRIWRLLRRGVQEAGAQRLPPAPGGPAFAPARIRACVGLGEALSDRGPWTVVLDGFPTGTPGQLGSELEIVLDHAGRALRMVLLCQSDPALDVHRFLAAGELVQVSEADLAMDGGEIADMLRLANRTPDRRAVAAVADHTAGWACGVRRAAVSVATTKKLSAAMEATDRAIEDYLAHEVLAAMRAPVRRLLVWTSVVEVAAPGVVREVLGPDSRRAIDQTMAATGLVRRSADGSITCHPLLRAAARSRLSAELTREASAAHQRVVRWFAEHGEPDAAVELSLAVQDWTAAASILVQAHAVPRIVAGTANDVLVRAAALPQVQAVEPLLQTAFALARDDLLAAEVAFGSRVSTRGSSSPAELIAAAFLRLGIARLSGDPPAEPGLVRRTRALLAQASVSDPGLGDLAIILDAVAGALEVATGNLNQAVIALKRGADQPGTAHGRLATADCQGQLALIEAHRGNLSEAARLASSALIAASDEQRTGVTHARIAMAWVHVDRGELPQARAQLERTQGTRGAREPWLVVARQLVEGRVLIASGRPEEAMRLAASREQALEGMGGSEWFRGLLVSLSAEALLAADEPKQALALVTSELDAGSAARAVLTAVARRAMGDARGAGAALASAAHDMPGAPRALQLQGWVLEARLAHEQDHLDRTILLVERALRAAGAEELRRPLSGDGVWLRWFLDRDGAVLRDHRPFVMSLQVSDPRGTSARHPSFASADLVIEPLTERETQVLGLLALMCSTEEIAAELFVSANTVKTHLKGIFRKYGVSRRVDAVRRGRELGVC
jgi:LuxR family maltose regulon positive regulatory protein